MAKGKFKKLAAIKDTEGGNFGNYKEGNGGGTPRGGVWGGQNGRVGWSEREKSGELPNGAHREEQPRTKDGKFTYNSVNGKETKYESRGETVNPLLTEGQNGIYINDVDKRGKVHDGVKSQFARKSGSLYDKYKDKWYRKGDELATKEGKKFKIKLSANDIWEIARVSFDIKKGAFNYEQENWDESKKGRHSKDEKAAMQGAKKANQAQFVANPTGGIQQKKGAQPGQQLSTGIPFQINPSIISKFRKMQAVKAMGMPGAGTSTFGAGATVQPMGNGNNFSQLKGGQKQAFNINSNLVPKLASLVQKYSAQPVAQQNAPKPKVSLGGFFNKPKI